MNTLGTYTLFRKETRRFSELWSQTIIAPVIQNVLFMIIFGVAFSSRVSPFEGVDYLAMLVPGLVAMAITSNAFQNPMSSLIIGKYTNVVTDIFRIPLSGYEITTAYIASATLRGLLVGGVTLIVGAFFTPIPFANILVILLFAFLLSATFSAFGIIIGVTSPSFDRASMVTTFIITPLTYLGGVFFSISTLPPTLEFIARLNPLLYMVDGLRYGFIGTGDSPLWLSLLVTSLLFIINFAIASWMFQTGYKLKT